MSAAIQIEANTQFAQNWIQSLFQNRDTDTRFESVKYHSFHSVESLTNASQISFNLPRFLGPNCYIPHKMMLKVSVKIVDTATNDVPTNIQRVAPVNNVLHSLFSSCRVWLGETPISKNPENYAHKSYIIDLLSFDGFAKFTWLQAQGFYQDTFGNTLAQQTSAANSGFQDRRNLFLKDSSLPTSGYAEDGIVLMGRLHTDLVNADCGLIPGLGMRIVLGLSNSSFVLQAPATDTAKYKILVTNATLFCPVGTISSELFRSIETKLKTVDAKMYIERTEVTNKTIPKNSTIYNDHLFPGAPLPSRLILAFVKTENYLGTQASSPFFFQRKFKVPKSPGPPQPGTSASLSGRRKSAPTIPPSSTPEPSGGLARKAASMIRSTISGTTTEDDFDILDEDQDAAPQLTDVEGTDTHVFIEKVSVTLNGEQVDGLEEGVATSVSDTANFVRLHLLLGLLTTTTGNNVTFDEFHRGFFFLIYDLSTSSNAAAAYVVPAIRQGNLQVQVTFSGPTPFELTMLVYAEYPTLITMDKYRQIRMSY